MFRDFYSRIYKKWSKTNKLFFWMGMISIILSIIFGIPQFFAQDKILVVNDNGTVFTTPSNFSFKCSGGVEQFPIRIINTKNVPVYNARVIFELESKSNISMNDFNFIVDESYIKKDASRGSVFSDNFAHLNIDYTYEKKLYHVLVMNVNVIDPSYIPMVGFMNTRNCVNEQITFKSRVACYQDTPTPAISLNGSLFSPSSLGNC